MLKTLDILIGATTVILIFSMAVTVVTQAITSIRGRKGKHLVEGLADLLQQLNISKRAIAEDIAHAVMTHPMFADGKSWWGLSKKAKPGTVISREEFTKILLDAGQAVLNGDQAKKVSPQLSDSDAYGVWSCLGQPARTALIEMLHNNGIATPGATLDQVRKTALALEASDPGLASNVRQAQALIRDATSDYLARVNAWFDQTIDRVIARFTKYTHYVTIAVATVVVLSVQLDIIAVVDRLSVDDKFRDGIVDSAIQDVGAPKNQQPMGQTGNQSTPQTNAPSVQTTAGDQNTAAKLAAQPYYDALSAAGLITIPGFDSKARKTWIQQWSVSKLPGMLLAILLVSLGAPFWYGILKNLLGLRSALATKDDEQRLIRQTTQPVQTAVAAVVSQTEPKAPQGGG